MKLTATLKHTTYGKNNEYSQDLDCTINYDTKNKEIDRVVELKAVNFINGQVHSMTDLMFLEEDLAPLIDNYDWKEHYYGLKMEEVNHD